MKLSSLKILGLVLVGLLGYQTFALCQTQAQQRLQNFLEKENRILEEKKLADDRLIAEEKKFKGHMLSSQDFHASLLIISKPSIRKQGITP